MSNFNAVSHRLPISPRAASAQSPRRVPSDASAVPAASVEAPAPSASPRAAAHPLAAAFAHDVKVARAAVPKNISLKPKGLDEFELNYTMDGTKHGPFYVTIRPAPSDSLLPELERPLTALIHLAFSTMPDAGEVTFKPGTDGKHASAVISKFNPRTQAPEVVRTLGGEDTGSEDRPVVWAGRRYDNSSALIDDSMKLLNKLLKSSGSLDGNIYIRRGETQRP